MSQLNLLILELVLSLSMIIILYKKYSKTGLYIYCAITIVLASIMSLKTITLYNYDINLGITSFVTIFTITNIIIQKNGVEEAKKILLTTIASLLFSYLILFLTSLMTSSNISLFTSASYNNIFNESLRIFFAIFVTTLYSLLLNIKLYYYLKKIKNNILISNLFSTIIIHFIASVLFGLISYIFTKEPLDIIKIIMFRYLFSLCIGIVSTVVIYITNKIKIKE